MRGQRSAGASWWRPLYRVATLWAVASLILGAGSQLEAAAAKLRGAVVDSAGQPLGDAVVAVASDEGEVSSTRTDKQGRFKLAIKAPRGSYVVRVGKPGYLAVEEPVVLGSGDSFEVSFALMTEREAAARASEMAEAESRERAAQLYNEGATAYNAGNPDAALGYLEQAIEADPELAIAWGAIARIRLETEAWEQAVEAAQRLVELRPEEVPLLLLYDAHWSRGDRAGARAVADRLRREFPGPGIANRLFNAGVVSVREGDSLVAREYLEAALELDGDLYQARLPLAEVLVALGDLEAALRQVESYVEAEPSTGRAHLLRIEIYRQLNRPDEAQRALEELRVANPHAALRLFFDEGVRHFSSGRSEQAIVALRQALEIDPDHPRSHYQLGLAYASLNRLDDARRELEAFLALAPDDPEAGSVRRMIDLLR